MKYEVDRTKLTKVGCKLYDMLVALNAYEEFPLGVLCFLKGDEKRQKLIDIIERDNITDDEEIISIVDDINDGLI